MNELDLLIVLGVVSAGFIGYRLGFVTRVVSWIGLTLGLVVAAKIAPSVIRQMHSDGASSRYLFVAIALLVGFGFGGQALGLFIGSRLHHTIPDGTARRV